jgi:hypothetical protein
MELKPNGSSIPVTEANKHEYASMLIGERVELLCSCSVLSRVTTTLIVVLYIFVFLRRC